jgi:hypothetical protein
LIAPILFLKSKAQSIDRKFQEKKLQLKNSISINYEGFQKLSVCLLLWNELSTIILGSFDLQLEH